MKSEHRGQAGLRKHLREHDQKAALLSEIRKRRNKLANLGLTHLTLSHGYLKSPKTSHQYTQLHMLTNCQFDAAKVAPNTKRHNFACNRLQ